MVPDRPGVNDAARAGRSTDGSTDPTVVCTDVTRTFTRRAATGWLTQGGDGVAEAVTAVSDVSLSVFPGELVGFAGPSGSGKSTLLHLLAGLDTPTSGTVTLAGERTDRLSARRRTRLRLDHVGIVFQQFHLLPSLSARANVAVPLVETGYPKQSRRDRAEALLRDVGLGDRIHHKPGALSGGERQRVAIARALVTDPDLVIADEPTGELDTTTGETVLSLLETAASNRAVAVASHDRRVLDRADRLIELRDGQIRSGGE